MTPTPRRDETSRIDCHTHLFPKEYVSELRRMNAPPPLIKDDRFLTPEKRVEEMERAGIDRQVVSIAVPGVDVSTPEASVRLARIANDGLSDLVGGDERFLPLASLPMLSPGEAVGELERAVGDLGFRGAGMFTPVAGRPVDLPEFWPVYEAASRMRVPLFLHPTVPEHKEIYKDYSLLSVLGFPFETTHAATRLALSGLLEEHPGVTFVLSHLGGTLPYLVGRIDDGKRLFGSDHGELPKLPSEYLQMMYLDAASFYEPALECAYMFWGADKIVLGSDYPYGWVGDLKRCVESVENLEMDENDRRKIMHLNAERLLNLSSTI